MSEITSRKKGEEDEVVRLRGIAMMLAPVGKLQWRPPAWQDTQTNQLHSHLHSCEKKLLVAQHSTPVHHVNSSSVGKRGQRGSLQGFIVFINSGQLCSCAT